MHPLRPKADVGVIIGRFQVHELHEGHRALIDDVVAHHDKLIVFLGSAHVKLQSRNPLNFIHRSRMIREVYPQAETWPLPDMSTDEAWSENLDHCLTNVLQPGQTAVLYGGRDSFVAHYSGRWPTCELEPADRISGQEIRRRIANQHSHTKDFRAGLIAATFDRFPTMYVAADTIVFNWSERTLLLGRKSFDTAWRLPGGFSDPRSTCLEDDAKREVREETGLEVGNLHYLANRRVDDWRYRDSEDAILSVLFAADYTFGAARAGDDLEEVRWFTFNEFANVKLVPEHAPYRAQINMQILSHRYLNEAVK